MTKVHLATFRERLHLEEEIPDEALDADEPPYYRPAAGSAEYEYMMERRRALSGSLPKRVVRHRTLPAPDAKAFAEHR